MPIIGAFLWLRCLDRVLSSQTGHLDQPQPGPKLY
jgi:hypothetical protein